MVVTARIPAVVVNQVRLIGDVHRKTRLVWVAVGTGQVHKSHLRVSHTHSEGLAIGRQGQTISHIDRLASAHTEVSL